jgi:hypothetical protein
MRKWRNYIKENPSFFDDQEPEEGHFERFEERLNRSTQRDNNKRTALIKRVSAFSIAASIAILVLVGIRFFSSPNAVVEEISAGQNLKEEFLTTDDFYQEQMNKQIEVIQCKLASADSQTRNQLEKDLQSIRNENKHFVKEIQNDENEELAIFYLVKHYRANLRALQFINDKLGKQFEC